SRSRNETESLPKNEKRSIANEAIVPRTRAIAVAASPTLTDSHRDERRNGSCQATVNQWVDQFEMGQLWIGDALNAYSAMITSGIQRNTTTPAVQSPSTMRPARDVIREPRTRRVA